MCQVYFPRPNGRSTRVGGLRFRSQPVQNESDLIDAGESNLMNRRISIKNDIGSSQETSGRSNMVSRFKGGSRQSSLPSIIKHPDSPAVLIESELSCELKSTKLRTRISREVNEGSLLNTPSRLDSEEG